MLRKIIFPLLEVKFAVELIVIACLVCVLLGIAVLALLISGFQKLVREHRHDPAN